MTKPETMLMIALCVLASLIGFSEGQRNHQVREMSAQLDQVLMDNQLLGEAVGQLLADFQRIEQDLQLATEALSQIYRDIEHIETMLRFPNG